MKGSFGMSEPPEGAIKGEVVHPNSEPENFNEQKIKQVMNELKTRGEVFRKMSDSELRERAVDFCRKYEVDIDG